MVFRGSSGSYRWSLVLWAGLLSNSLSITLGRFSAPPNLQSLLSSFGLVLCSWYFWAVLTKRCPRRITSYRPHERIVLGSLFVLGALLLTVCFLYPHR
jgi:hypothetical protein